MYNFFVNNEMISENKATITGDDFKHITKVLRMNVGEKIYICNKDNGESFLAQIEEINNENVFCNILEKMESNESNVNITLYQGIPKSDKMEYIIQKSIELGVNTIIPVNMKYCIAKIKDEEKKNTRWQMIAEAAAKQSKRNIIPKVCFSQNIEDICKNANEYDIILIAYENEDNLNIKNALQVNKDIKNIAIIVGPEGGISEDEVNVLVKNGAKSVSLGKRILRCETAPIVMLSSIMYEYEF